MKLLISTALISTAMIATSTMAQQPLQASTTLNTVELNTIFDASQLENLQATELSNQEMKDTQGAWVNFAVGAGIGFGGYALSNFSTSLSSAGCLACRGFVNSYQDNWSWSNAAFSTGVGALTSGVGGAAYAQRLLVALAAAVGVGFEPLRAQLGQRAGVHGLGHHIAVRKCRRGTAGQGQGQQAALQGGEKRSLHGLSPVGKVNALSCAICMPPPPLPGFGPGAVPVCASACPPAPSKPGRVSQHGAIQWHSCGTFLA